LKKSVISLAYLLANQGKLLKIEGCVPLFDGNKILELPDIGISDLNSADV
jgi:hypothetical protein